ncbi:hypothetical protein TPHA_0K00270 [Tetrapisispora phaffii CBS 4417]|uniref:Man1/Src1 C-terminal domain-containing protein n=1 Tax=Tetrapisispora phaffii (strain ATCC 24235 / CBS 4417 / NBRC 1672 / NRRL Y-8282 / UCD 70-5) TaxID=1071381 RepID=G8BZ33_TETPH|nr:hypothetical protein TPHA_0K00270 [Tetrapisispora phaffii CBS 4417]CCE65161.1 hypothetical protein TPHA_0K00270 [Tetrapisispora phaffii CBS 4417]
MEYLEPGFDPKKLKVPELRKILISNKIQFPSKCKKNELVKLFQNNISSNLEELRERNLNSEKDKKQTKSSNKKRQRKEIESTDDEETEESEQSTDEKSNSTSKKRKTSKIEEKPEMVNDTKHEIKSQNTEEVPKVEQRSNTKAIVESKLSETKPKTRRNIPLDLQKLQQSAIVKENKTEKTSDEKLDITKKEQPKTKTNPNDEKEETINESLDKEEENKSLVEEQKNKSPKEYKKTKVILKALVQISSFASIILLCFFTLWYREVCINIGYCGKELAYPPFLKTSITDKVLNNGLFEKYDIKSKLSDLIIPDCTPCPDNAICYSSMKSVCNKGYVPENSFYNLYGLLPLPIKCSKDKTEEKLVQDILNGVLYDLRLKNSRVRCGDGETDESTGLIEKNMFDSFVSQKAWLSEKQRQRIWRKVMLQLKKYPEIKLVNLYKKRLDADDSEAEVVNDHVFSIAEKMSHNLLRSTSKNFVPFYCGKSDIIISSNYIKPTLTILVFLFSIVVLCFLNKLIVNKLNDQTKCSVYIERIVEILKEIKENNKPQSFLTSNQLKEIIFKDEVENVEEQNRIWKKISNKLENSDIPVTSTQLELHGEILRSYEFELPSDSDKL